MQAFIEYIINTEVHNSVIEAFNISLQAIMQKFLLFFFYKNNILFKTYRLGETIQFRKQMIVDVVTVLLICEYNPVEIREIPVEIYRMIVLPSD